MSPQWLEVVICFLGMVIGGGGVYAGTVAGPTRYAGGFAGLFALVLFFAILFGEIH